jgi:hypothetical protein
MSLANSKGEQKQIFDLYICLKQLAAVLHLLKTACCFAALKSLLFYICLKQLVVLHLFVVILHLLKTARCYFTSALNILLFYTFILVRNRVTAVVGTSGVVANVFKEVEAPNLR